MFEIVKYFGARYNTSAFGRFMTPDWSAAPAAIPYAKLPNPQSLDLYTYVLDNPVTSVDSDGHCCDWVTDYLLYEGIQHPKFGNFMVDAATVAEGGAYIAGGAVVAAAGAGVGSVGAPETGGASIALTAMSIGVASGMVATGGIKITEGLTGKINEPNLNSAINKMQTVANPAGLVGTVVSGGNFKVGAKAAAGADLVTTGIGLASLTSGGMAQKVATVISAVQTGKELKSFHETCKSGKTNCRK